MLVNTIDAHSPVGRLIQLKVGAQVCVHVRVCVCSQRNHFILHKPFLTPALLLACIFKVMLTKNLDVARGLVNGARGVVVDFESGKHGPYLAVKIYLLKILRKQWQDRIAY